MKSSLLIYGISILLVLGGIVLSSVHIQYARKNQADRILLSEVNSIRYGLLSADEWRVQISEIIAKKIDEFELTAENRQQLKKQIQNLLYRLLNEVDKVLRNDMGRIKKFLMRAFIDLDKLRENVPQLTEQLLQEISKPENKTNIKNFILNKLEEVVSQTFSYDEQTKLKEILHQGNFSSREEASEILMKETTISSKKLEKYGYFTALILMVAFLIIYSSRLRFQKTGLFLLVMITLIFLVNGLAVPMIDIEAKIERISFSLLGEVIVFKDQVFFFQSKSILDVVWLLVTDGSWDMAAIGFLILLFSVLFPVAKIIYSYLAVLIPERYPNGRFAAFFTYYSGKWSMADVFVVALFMAFIGFNGIISNQLQQLMGENEYFEILTTNGTRLKSGFYLFVLFCLSGLFLSSLIHKMQKNNTNTKK